MTTIATIGDGLAALAAMRQQADELARATTTLTDDLTRRAADAGPALAEQLDSAALLSDEVFDSLRPFSGQFGRPAPVPEPVLAEGVRKLDVAIRLQDDAAKGIDTLLGEGTWMSKATRETRGFHDEARRVLSDPTLGPDSADHAIDLLRQNGFASRQAQLTLRAGDLDGMADRAMFQVIDDADQAAFDAAASWRTVFGRAPTS